MRWGGALVVGLVLLLASAGTGGATTAQACSLVGQVGARGLPDFFRESSIVAIGVLSDASSDRITFTVEEPLQGTTVGSSYTLDNRWPGLGPGCEVYGPGDLPGNRFDNGSHVLAGLAREVDGAWQPGYVAQGVMSVDDDALRPLALAPIYPEGNSPLPVVKVDDVRERVAALAGTPFDAGYEMRGPCNGAPFGLQTLPTYVADSTLAGIAHVSGSDETASMLVFDEVWRGTVAAGVAVTVNDHYLRPSSSSCTRELADRNPYPTGGQFLVFLRPDMYGTAEYQVSVFGQGMARVNERYVTYGAATLDDFRATAALLASARAPEQQDTDAPGRTTPGADGSTPAATAVAGASGDAQDGTGMVIAAAAAVVIAVVALYGASQTGVRRERGR